MRLALYARGKDDAGHMVRRAKPKNELMPSPATEGWGKRAKTPTPLAEMDRRIPAGAEAQLAANKRKFDTTANSKDLPRVATKVQAKLLTQTDYMNAYWGWVGIIQPEYELLEPWTIYDTESYFTRAVKRQKSLMFRNGFQIIGENETYRSYIEKRFQQISYFMGQTLENFFKELLVQLLVTSNCIVIKIRDNDASGGVANAKNKGKAPVAAYVLCPSHTIYPYLNGRGVVEKWRRFFADGRTFEDYAVDDIIHLHWDRKAGHLFGTPRTAPVRDDILALRRLEENIELLMIHHMFPLFHVAVGTDDEPADYNIDGTSEIDFVRNDIEAMPKEGMLVTDARVKVSAVGARGEALDYDSIVKHYKTRIFTGLGVSGVDMGEGDCYQQDTETLTESGWKLHNNIDHSKEKIATFNPETKKVEFHLPTYKYEGHYIGDVITFQGKHVDIRVTPHHDMWVRPRSSSKWRKVKAYELLDGRFGEFCLLESAEFEGLSGIRSFTIDAEKAVRGQSPTGVSCQLTDFAEFLGYYVSEGSLDTYNEKEGHYRSLISQNQGRVLDAIKDVSNRVGLSWREQAYENDAHTIVVYGKTLYKWLETNVGKGAHNKHLPSEVFLWSKTARSSLLNALIDGDGCRSKLKGRTSFTYYTVSQKLANDVQVLAMSLGYKAKIKLTKQAEDAYGDFIFKVIMSGTGRGENYRILNSSHVGKEHYEGTIYCYNVPNHLFVTRRNGKVTIQGNTANRSTSETVSQNLKDYVKEDLDWFCGLVQMAIIREFFQEAPFDLSVQNAVADVHLAFPEIDVDGMIKMETHTMNQFNNHLITEVEARKKMNRQPFTTEQRGNTHYKLHVLDLALKTIKAKIDGVLEAAHVQAEAKATPGGKATATKTQPTNQHGKNMDPHKARSSVDPQYFRPLYDMMMDLRKEMDEKGNLTNDTWRLQVPKLIYAYFNEITSEWSGTLYTNQARMTLNRVRDGLVALVPETTDPDLLSVVVRDAQEELLEHGIEVIDDGQDKRTSTDNRKPEHGDSSQEPALPKVGDPGPERGDLRGEHQPE